MAYKPFPKQVEAHRAFLLDKFKLGVLFWSRRTGKTQWSVQQLVYSCILNQGPHHIVFKEYQQAETVAWNQYLHTIPEGLIAHLDKSTLTITFNYIGTDANGNEAWVNFPEPIGKVKIEHDPSKPPSTIRLLGSDKADSHRGGESYGMIFDEYQDQDPGAWDAVYSKFFATTNGWACFMGTAKDIDHWNALLDNAEKDPDWYYSKATYRDNPLITPEWVMRDRKEAEAKGALGVWLQEMELIPFNIQGVVYPMFVKKIHTVQPEEVPDEGTDYIALDFGFAEGHPVAACFIRITHDDIWYVYDEIHGTGIQIDDLITTIRAKMADRRITAIVADSARPDLIDYMQSRGMPVVPSPKKQNSIIAGIQLVAKRLRPRIQVIGEPKPNLLFSSACPKTIYDFTHYKYKEIKKDRPASELPEKKNDDACDAIRYLELFFKFGQTNKKDSIKSGVKFNEYGLLS
jgi:hypothetical protein